MCDCMEAKDTPCHRHGEKLILCRPASQSGKPHPVVAKVRIRRVGYRGDHILDRPTDRPTDRPHARPSLTQINCAFRAKLTRLKGESGKVEKPARKKQSRWVAGATITKLKHKNMWAPEK